MKNGEQRQHAFIVAIFFILYAIAHLFVVTFVWIIALALAVEGYLQFLQLKIFGLVVLTLLLVLLPLIAAYSLLKQRWWAKRVVISTCLAVLSINVVALSEVLLSNLSRISVYRVALYSSYGAASLALCLYGTWSVSRKEALDLAHPVPTH